MQSATLGELFSHPGFLCLSLSILVAVVNIIVGINIHPQNKTYKGLHRYLYYAVMAGYSLFLVANYYLGDNTWLEYSVFLYLLLIVPRTQGINITLHAIFSSIGLFLLVFVAALGLF